MAQAQPPATPEPAKAGGAKRAKKVVEAEGIPHITATFNNTLITITDMQGNTLTWGSSGKAGFQGSKKSTPFAATAAAEPAARAAQNLAVRRAGAAVTGPAAGRAPARDGPPAPRLPSPPLRPTRPLSP